jgi:hypothetical protein
MDGRSIHHYEWLTGPEKGKRGRSYSVSFWRLPSRRERVEMGEALTSFEREKLLRGGYKGLKPEWFGQAAAEGNSK